MKFIHKISTTYLLAIVALHVSCTEVDKLGGSDINASIETNFEILSTEPSSARPGDEITINGSNFFDELTFSFGTLQKTKFGLVDSDKIHFTIPKTFAPGLTKITIIQAENEKTIPYMVLTADGEVPTEQNFAGNFLGEFSITSPIGPTSEYPPVASWSESEGATAYSILVNQTGDCSDTSTIFFEAKLYGQGSTSNQLSNLEDGEYFLCVTAIMGEEHDLGAENNGQHFSVDTSYPMVTISHSFADPNDENIGWYVLAENDVAKFRYKYGPDDSSTDCSSESGYSQERPYWENPQIIATEIFASSTESLKYCFVGTDLAGNYQPFDKATVEVLSKMGIEKSEPDPPILSSPSLATWVPTKVAITNIDFLNSGADIVDCQSSPALPSGLALTATVDNCTISGTPNTAQGITTYTITAKAEDGSSDEAVIDIEIRGAFVATWNTNNTGTGSSASNQIKLPLEYDGTYNFTVDWGDSTSAIIQNWGDALATHDYAASGTYTISIEGVINGFNFNGTGDKLKIHDVSSWGALLVGDNGHYFYGCENLTATATDTLDTSGVTNMSYMFKYAKAFNSPLNFDTSAVTSMSLMFYGADSFNEKLTFDTSSVTDMNSMFNGALAYNKPLNFNTSNVLSMNAMFQGASNFNQNLNFDTQSITSMDNMFNAAISFNQAINFNTSNVTSMNNMFRGATAFNQPLNFSDTANLTSVISMFQNAANFNHPLNFNTSNVFSMMGMFDGAASFNQTLDFDTTSVTSMFRMFAGAAAFNQPLDLDTSSVTSMYGMFMNATSLDSEINFDTTLVQNMSSMFFGAAQFNQPLNFNTSSVVNMNNMFANAGAFNQNLESWDIRNVEDMANIFDSTALSSSNLDSTLIGWGSQGGVQSNVTIGGIGLTRTSGSDAAVNTLTSAPNFWTFSGF